MILMPFLLFIITHHFTLLSLVILGSLRRISLYLFRICDLSVGDDSPSSRSLCANPILSHRCNWIYEEADRQCFRPEVKQQKKTDTAESMPHFLPKLICFCATEQARYEFTFGQSWGATKEILWTCALPC